MQQENAQIIGMKALAWLASQDEVFQTFLNASGAQLVEVRQRAQDPQFLLAVLDFVLLEDQWVIGFAQETGEAPEVVMAARRTLGGPVESWG